MGGLSKKKTLDSIQRRPIKEFFVDPAIPAIKLDQRKSRMKARCVGLVDGVEEVGTMAVAPQYWSMQGRGFGWLKARTGSTTQQALPDRS